MEKKKIEESLKILENLPSGRKIFFNTGLIMVELTKEEAIERLKQILLELENKENNKKN